MPEPLPTARSDWALFLDIDGTLIDIAATPDAVEIPAALLASLGMLDGAFGGALALVSGRSIVTVDRLFAPLSLAVAGQHGAELRHDDEIARTPPPEALLAVAEALTDFAASRPGVIVETKGLSVAVHFRQAPLERKAAEALVRRLVGAEHDELALLPARRAFDIRPRRVSKGTAIEWFLARPPFAGRVPVFVGDDTTDEDGFVAVNARGGHSIKVGHLGASAARFRIHSPAELRGWLATCVADLAREDAWRE